MSNRRWRLHPTSVVVRLDHPPFSVAEIDTFDSTKTNLRLHRNYLTDYTFLLLKEMHSRPHASASRLLESDIAAAIVTQTFQYSETPARHRIIPYGDGGARPGVHKLSDIGLSLPHFRGEPDGGLAWVGQSKPVIVIEMGVSDSETKT